MRRNSLPIPVKFEALEKHLEGFDKDKLDLLQSGFKEGFKIFFDGKDTSLESRNSKSALLNPKAVTKKLQNELDMGRIAGPFRDKPFRGKFKCSPLAIREKEMPGQYCLLHDLSYPYLFSWENKWYYDRCFPMGCSSSCRLFSGFTDAIAYILMVRYGVKNLVKCLDDFLFIVLTRKECQRCLDSFLELCREACIPVAQHKTVCPCWCLVFLGAELDTNMMHVRLPVDKLQRYSLHIEDIIKAGKVSLRDLQSIIGQLQYATCVVNPGNGFLRRLINLTIA